MLITCRKTNFVLVYFLQTFKALPILHAITDDYRFCLTQFKVRWRKIKSDQELARSALIQIRIAANGIVHEPSAPPTQAQDGHAERSGGVIGRRQEQCKCLQGYQTRCFLKWSRQPCTFIISYHATGTTGDHHTNCCTNIASSVMA
jgi:hypothetical protein